MQHPSFELTVPVSAVDHILGPEHAPVTIVEYGDFECPSCKQAVGAVKVLLAQFDQKVKFVFRHFPQEGVHPHALLAAEVAECAGAQGKFWPMHAMLFEHQDHLKAPQLKGYAETLGLDMARYAGEMDDHIYLQRVREHQASGSASGVRSTPTFYVNGKLHDVSYGLHSLSEAVGRALGHR